MYACTQCQMKRDTQVGEVASNAAADGIGCARWAPLLLHPCRYSCAERQGAIGYIDRLRPVSHASVPHVMSSVAHVTSRVTLVTSRTTLSLVTSPTTRSHVTSPTTLSLVTSPSPLTLLLLFLLSPLPVAACSIRSLARWLVHTRCFCSRTRAISARAHALFLLVHTRAHALSFSPSSPLCLSHFLDFVPLFQ